MPDPAYLANVSSAFMAALQEAQALIAAGHTGAPLVEVVRHARELHEIMVEESAAASPTTGEHPGGALLDLGERLAALERHMQEH